LFFLAKVGPEIYAVLFPLLCVFIPVVILAIFVVVKKIVKNAKRASKMKANTGVDYEAYFGGHDNILNIEIKMSRVNVTVKDVDKVDFEQLKTMNMGVLVVGNVVKCASSEFVALVETNLNK
jgi:hypothetical protein